MHFFKERDSNLTIDTSILPRLGGLLAFANQAQTVGEAFSVLQPDAVEDIIHSGIN